jgi:hypothetical protein
MGEPQMYINFYHNYKVTHAKNCVIFAPLN